MCEDGLPRDSLFSLHHHVFIRTLNRVSAVSVLDSSLSDYPQALVEGDLEQNPAWFYGLLRRVAAKYIRSYPGSNQSFPSASIHVLRMAPSSD
jgi:hypothetical protein